MTRRRDAVEDWIWRGRQVRVLDELGRRQHLARMKRSGRELVGPCPLCGGTDRFSVNPAKNVWNCRGCAKAGDAIALVENVDGVRFMHAIEILTGEPMPGHDAAESEAEREARHAALDARIAAAKADAAREAAEQHDYREVERQRMLDVFAKAQPIAGTPAEMYLRIRGVSPPPGAHLCYLPRYALWSGPKPHGALLHRGPAMVGVVVGPDGKFSALHFTWIDLGDPDGKVRIADPETGELVPAKKVRGSKRGGTILLARPPRGEARTLILGEGIETVLSVRAALVAAGAPLIEDAEWRSAVDLGNLAGRALGRVAHPTLTTTDKRGRTRRVLVGNAEPHPDTLGEVIAIGAGIERIVLLGDGDSEPFATDLALRRAAARFSACYPWVQVGLAMSPSGQDFNDLWRELLAQGTAMADEAPTALEPAL